MPPQDTPLNGQLDQIVERLKTATNVLVTVSSSPSVDQLSACIGLTLILNKLDKHGTAVFSGKIPSTIEFLKPEKTIEKNTDSLRDFIISLDKSKADKLRYKVEDEVVKIFITPYRTTITKKDFDFSQGDFNVDAVVALGVHNKTDLDMAITTHGRILHDATVMSVNNNAAGHGESLGTISWFDGDASSLCEMVADLVGELGEQTLDNQIATALLTGIIAETNRFSNEKSTPHTMSVSGRLMEAGASTQLITTKLEEHQVAEKKAKKDSTEKNHGTLEITHDKHGDDEAELPDTVSFPEPPMPDFGKVAGDEAPLKNDNIKEVKAAVFDTETPHEERRKRTSLITEPPTLGGQLTANSVPEYASYSPTTDPLSDTRTQPTMRKHKKTEHVDKKEADIKSTLEDIEKSVHSPHIAEQEGDNGPPLPLESARHAVEEAVDASEEMQPDDPIKALNAQEFGEIEHEDDEKPAGPPPPVPPPMLPNNP